MAKKGEAGRALSAAYMASLLGGLFGALLMAVSIPILRPVMLYLGSPELLAFAVLGISMVAILVRQYAAARPRRRLPRHHDRHDRHRSADRHAALDLRQSLSVGRPAAGAGVLGLFALPELCDLAIKRSSPSPTDIQGRRLEGHVAGRQGRFRNWWLVLRCSWIGAGLGAIPGIGGSVVDWIAYGHALRTEKGAQQTFGRGDVRGVIASESSNNAKEGGALVPTVAFGVPGSASMAILLGAFLIHGLVPGPDMLTKNLDITYAMVWSVALANILGAGLCFLFSGAIRQARDAALHA